MQLMGFNTIRLPFSFQQFESAAPKVRKNGERNKKEGGEHAPTPARLPASSSLITDDHRPTPPLSLSPFCATGPQVRGLQPDG